MVSSGDSLSAPRLQTGDGVVQGQPGAADAGGAGAAVGLDHIAIDDNLAFAQFFQVHHRAQAAADQPLDFLGAAALLAAGGFARFMRLPVERGSMPYSAVTQPWPLPLRKPGTFSSTLAVQILACRQNTSTEPSAWRVK